MNEFNTLFKRTKEFSVNFSHNKIKSYKFRIEKCFGVSSLSLRSPIFFPLLLSFCTTRILRRRRTLCAREKCGKYIYFIIIKRSLSWAAYKSWWNERCIHRELLSNQFLLCIHSGIVLVSVLLFLLLLSTITAISSSLQEFFILQMAEGSTQCTTLYIFCFVCYALALRFKIFTPTLPHALLYKWTRADKEFSLFRFHRCNKDVYLFMDIY